MNDDFGLGGFEFGIAGHNPRHQRLLHTYANTLGRGDQMWIVEMQR